MLEPVLDWNDLRPGRRFEPATCRLDDALVDAYLRATGEDHALYRSGYAPASLTTMVRFAKQSLQGRWPSGTVQTTQRLASHRPLRRGETLSIGCRVSQRDARDGRGRYELSAEVSDADGRIACESAAWSIWGTPVAAAASTEPAAAPASAASRTSAESRTSADSRASAGPRASTGSTNLPEPVELARLQTHFGMPQMRARRPSSPSSAYC